MAKMHRAFWLNAIVLVTLWKCCVGFLPPLNSPRGRNPLRGNNGNGDDGLPPQSNEQQPWWSSNEPPIQPLYGKCNRERNETETELRGGSSPQQAVDNVSKGTQATLSSSASYWKKAFGSFTSTITKPLVVARKKVGSVFQSKEKKREAELLEQLKTVQVKRVTVPNSTVLPSEVVQLAAKRSGVLGSPLKTDQIQDFAAALKRWYTRKGYVLHSVTGATLKPESATAEIEVQEPKIAKTPVGITFCKEMVVDDDTGNLLTFRQYKEKHATRRTFGHEKITKADLNTTLVPTGGRTRPGRIASALKLSPGKPFRWDGNRWNQIATSGIFASILRAAPQPMSDGTVQLHIVATEAPTRHLEYGVGKSLYTGSWEGELDFEHANLLGGGEKVGVSVRRGAKDAEPSVRVCFTDDRFGLEGGYDVEVFSDFIGDEPDEAQEGAGPVDYDHDSLLDRRGASIRVRNPIDPHVIQHSSASIALERTSTKTGLHEKIGSASMSVGPFLKVLPLGARSNVDAKFSAGTRIADIKEEPIISSRSFLPFGSATATTSQVFPLLGSVDSDRRPLVLALRHSLTTSSRNLPRHEARAQGIANTIRGSLQNGRVASAVRGTTELRVPVQLPIKTTQDAGVVLFGDWLLATKDSLENLRRKSCVGLGFRKSIQGIPLKCDLSYSSEGKLKAAVGIGRDFDV